MPAVPSAHPWTYSRSCAIAASAPSSVRPFAFGTIRYRRLGRLKLCWKHSQLGLSLSDFFTSSAQVGVAVAVSATKGTAAPSSRRSLPSWAYSGRKSWPHSLTQCASSTTTRASSRWGRAAPRRASTLWRVWLAASISGVTYSSLVSGAGVRLRSSSTRALCPGGELDDIQVAGTPRYPGAPLARRRPSTWSWMSASSGLTTIVTPGERTAGSW